MKHSLVYIMSTNKLEERVCPYCEQSGIIKQELVRESRIGTNEQRWVHPMGLIKYDRQYVIDAKGKPTQEVSQWGETKGRLCPKKSSGVTLTKEDILTG